MQNSRIMRATVVLAMLCIPGFAAASEQWGSSWTADTLCVEASGETLAEETPTEVRTAVLAACTAALAKPGDRKDLDAACNREVSKLHPDERLAGGYLCSTAVDIGFQ